MKYKNVLKYAFYEMINAKDQYILFNADDYTKLNPVLMVRFLKIFFIMNNPIIPHFTEYMYITYLNPIFEKSGLDSKKIANASKIVDLPTSFLPIMTDKLSSRSGRSCCR